MKKVSLFVIGTIILAAMLPCINIVQSVGVAASQVKQNGDAPRIVAEPQDFFGLNQVIQEIITDFELKTKIQKELLGFALRWDAKQKQNKPSGIAITLMLPSSTGDTTVKRFSKRNADQQFTIQMTKVYSPGNTTPFAVVVLAEISANGGLAIREKIGFYDDAKGWQTPPLK